MTGSEFHASAWVKRLTDSLDELAQAMTATRINMSTRPTVNIAAQVPAAQRPLERRASAGLSRIRSRRQLGRIVERVEILESHAVTLAVHFDGAARKLQHNMRGFKAVAASIININPWYEREAGAPAHLVGATTLGKPPIPIFFTSLLRSRSRGRRTDGSFTAAA